MEKDKEEEEETKQKEKETRRRRKRREEAKEQRAMLSIGKTAVNSKLGILEKIQNTVLNRIG